MQNTSYTGRILKQNTVIKVYMQVIQFGVIYSVYTELRINVHCVNQQNQTLSRFSSDTLSKRLSTEVVIRNEWDVPITVQE